METDRFFLGNLPLDSTEESVKKKLNKYLSSIELKRKQNFETESVYAFVNVPKSLSEKFLKKYNNKKWNGHTLKIEMAKKSFFSKLKEEIDERNRNDETHKQEKFQPNREKKEIKKININYESYGKNGLNKRNNLKSNVKETTQEVERNYTNSEPNDFEIVPSDFKAVHTNTDNVKRLNAIENQRKYINERKKLIQNSLNKIDLKRHKENFEEETITEENLRAKRIKLFDQESDDDFDTNFDIKPHLEGKNGLKLLKLKSTLSNDERFQITEKFLEDDKEEENTKFPRTKNGNTRNFQESNFNSIIRYDPTKEEHKKYEKKAKEKIVKKIKKKKETHKEELKENKEIKVSNEKFYKINESLKDAFNKNEDKGFSLLQMFSKVPEIEKNELNENGKEEKIAENQVKFRKPIKWFQNETELSDIWEEEEIESENKIENEVSEKILGTGGVWSEKFFFRPNDPRFQESIEFIRGTRKEDKFDFRKERIKLKSIVTRKYKNSQRDKKMFKNKLSTKISRNKLKSRLKSFKK